MQKLIILARRHYKIVSAAVVGLVAGAAITGFGVVQAAIPDASGTIHGCRNNTTTMLRVVDSASQSCDGNETGLNWDQGGVKGYAHVTWSSGTYVLDSARSKNISNFYVVPVGIEEITYYICFTSSSTPKSISVTEGTVTVESSAASFKDSNGWTGIGSVCDNNGSGANVAILVFRSNQQPFVTLF